MLFFAVHLLSSDACAAGTRFAGRQCAPPQTGAQSASDEGSITGGPVYGHMPPPPSPLSPISPPPAAQSFWLISHAPVGVPLNGLRHGTHSSPSPPLSCPSTDDGGMLAPSGINRLK